MKTKNFLRSNKQVFSCRWCSVKSFLEKGKIISNKHYCIKYNDKSQITAVRDLIYYNVAS